MASSKGLNWILNDEKRINETRGIRATHSKSEASFPVILLENRDQFRYDLHSWCYEGQWEFLIRQGCSLRPWSCTSLILFNYLLHTWQELSLPVILIARQRLFLWPRRSLFPQEQVLLNPASHQTTAISLCFHLSENAHPTTMLSSKSLPQI